MPRKDRKAMYADKSEAWKRARATAMAKVVLKSLYAEQYEEIYKRILKEEFGLVSTQRVRHKPGSADKYAVDYVVYKSREG